jgi:hypothetical protein
LRRSCAVIGIAAAIIGLLGTEAHSADCSEGPVPTIQGVAARIGLGNGFMTVVPVNSTQPCNVFVVLVPISRRVPCRVGARFTAAGVVEETQSVGRTLLAETLSCE